MLNEGVIHHGPVLSIGELLRFSDLIKGVPGLSKVVIITDTVYYSEKIQTEISNGKKASMAGSRRDQVWSLHLSSPSGVT